MFDAMMAAIGGSMARAPWGWMILALLIGGFFKFRPEMKRLAAAREESLLKARADDNAELKRRVEALERRLEADRAKHDAEQARDRHKIANLNSCLDALLMMLELAPDKVAEHVAKIKAMRAEQLRIEAQEAAAIRAAAITAAAAPATEEKTA
jgi:chromosome segregation ATPase